MRYLGHPFPIQCVQEHAREPQRFCKIFSLPFVFTKYRSHGAPLCIVCTPAWQCNFELSVPYNTDRDNNKTGVQHNMFSKQPHRSSAFFLYRYNRTPSLPIRPREAASQSADSTMSLLAGYMTLENCTTQSFAAYCRRYYCSLISHTSERSLRDVH